MQITKLSQIGLSYKLLKTHKTNSRSSEMTDARSRSGIDVIALLVKYLNKRKFLNCLQSQVSIVGTHSVRRRVDGFNSVSGREVMMFLVNDLVKIGRL